MSFQLERVKELIQLREKLALVVEKRELRPSTKKVNTPLVNV